MKPFRVMIVSKIHSDLNHDTLRVCLKQILKCIAGGGKDHFGFMIWDAMREILRFKFQGLLPKSHILVILAFTSWLSRPSYHNYQDHLKEAEAVEFASGQAWWSSSIRRAHWQALRKLASDSEWQGTAWEAKTQLAPAAAAGARPAVTSHDQGTHWHSNFHWWLPLCTDSRVVKDIVFMSSVTFGHFGPARLNYALATASEILGSFMIWLSSFHRGFGFGWYCLVLCKRFH